MSRHLLIRADARRIPLADRSVHCVVTSPPYWGLRDYGVPGQIGLEPTPEEYVATMVDVFREVWRVLRDDGTAWLNLGDSYANDPSSSGDPGPRLEGRANIAPPGKVWRGGSLKKKDMVGIPWRVAFALQAHGWYLRSDIIWSKPNPMPESVQDRPTKAHEYLFLLAKREAYFYDADAIREADGGRPSGNGFTNRQGAADYHATSGGVGSGEWLPGGGRNRRSVWECPTQPFPGAHFATFPPRLIEPCIKAGTSERGCCPACGSPWERETEVGYENPGNRGTNGPRSIDRKAIEYGTAGYAVRLEKRVKTLGWRPSCACPDADPVPSIVLDPFGGVMTTMVVAEALGRRGIATELSAEYLALGRRRLDRPHAPVGRPAEDLDPLPLFAGSGVAG